MIKKIIPPEEGGCWFCYSDEGQLEFDTEFDTYVHIDCIKKALEKDPKDSEALFMSYLFE